MIPENDIPLVLPRDDAWTPHNPCSPPWGYLFCWKPGIKIQFGVYGDWWQTANGPAHIYCIPWNVLGSFAISWQSGSKAGARGSGRRKWCYRNSGKWGRSQGRQGISLTSLPSHFTLIPFYTRMLLHVLRNQFMPDSELWGFYFWSHCCWVMATPREENLPSCKGCAGWSRHPWAHPKQEHGVLALQRGHSSLADARAAAGREQVWRASVSETSAENAWN